MTREPEDLRAVRGVIEGDDVLVVSYPLDGPGEGPLAVLTAAQRDVARLLAIGFTPLEIAARRGSAASTVARQISQIYKRLSVGNRAELVALILLAR